MADTRTKRIRLGRGKSTLILSDGQASLVREAVDEGMPGVLERLEQEAEDHYAAAREAWPVRKGWSRDALNWWIRLPKGDLSVIEGFVGFEPGERGTEYAHLVKGRKDGGKQSWRVHLQKPMRERSVRLNEDVVARLRAILNGEV